MTLDQALVEFETSADEVHRWDRVQLADMLASKGATRAEIERELAIASLEYAKWKAQKVREIVAWAQRGGEVLH
jgi:hypothetical protein